MGMYLTGGETTTLALIVLQNRLRLHAHHTLNPVRAFLTLRTVLADPHP